MQSSTEVLALKYRPKNFSELIGQEGVSRTLSLALDGKRLSHAYLFSGLRGSGKTSTARIFAKALLCEEGVSHNPCGKCQSCVMAAQNRHIDIVEMDGASSRKIDDIRELIEQTKYKPAVGRYKIFIIDEVHMLTREAFNALLKTLEEPPPFVKFILATTDPLKLPATILSRTQHFRFKPIATIKIAQHLQYILELEQIGFEKEALEILARSGNGSLRDTLTLLDQAIIYSKGHVDVATVTDMLGLVDPKFIAQIFQAIFANDKARVLKYIKELEGYEAQMVVDELIVFLKERLFDGDGGFSPLIIERYFAILSQSKHLFSINADGSFVLSLVFFKMLEALKIKEIDTLIEEFEKGVLVAQPSKSQHLTKPQTTQSFEQNEEPQHPAKPQQEQDVKQNEEPQHLVKPQATQGSKPHVEPQKQIDLSQDPTLYNQLVRQIQDRNMEMGECFEKFITFKSYEQNILTWESCVDASCKECLRHGYSVVKMLVKEIFGFDTKIKNLPCSDSKSTQKELPSKTEPPVAVSKPEPSHEAIEGANGSSCVATCAGLDESSNEVDEILKEPMVQMAIQLFGSKKVHIQGKV